MQQLPINIRIQPFSSLCPFYISVEGTGLNSMLSMTPRAERHKANY